VDSPELNTPDGKAAAAFTADVLAKASDIRSRCAAGPSTGGWRPSSSMAATLPRC
jgi:hypothetical protein